MKLFYKLLGYTIEKTDSYNESIIGASKLFPRYPNVFFTIIIKNKYYAYKVLKLF